MAAAGGGGGAGESGTGGKIRSRRYHLSSGRTPYSKSRQRQVCGIISRVTDAVKSIVPGWLQNYFNKQEEERGRAHNASELIVEDTEGRQNNTEHHIYVDDEGNSASGRVTPEPIINVDEEVPSTSQSAINDTDALTRPSLHRANLNFNLFDSPAMNCQPTTSTFPIGTSGFSLVKEIKDSTSQHDDDNISTTSGFSSRASDKDMAVSKNVGVPPLWSPEVDRSQSLSHNSSMTSKKPTFNLSAFSSLSPSLGNASFVNSQLGDSPFYPGKTTYQGAAAVRSSRVRSNPYQAPLRRQVKAKPANAQQYGVTSSTARRILQSLEKMSSPLADAKRIPSNSLSHTPEKSLMDIAENPSKRKKVESPFPPVQKLVTPKSISVSTNRSLYIKPSLTPSAVSNTSSRRVQPDKHNESRENNVQTVQSTSHSFSYPKFSTPTSNELLSRGGGKMMRQKGSHYSTKPAEETSGLTSSSPLFTFSSPIVKSTESNAQSPGSSVDFTFSVPTVKVSSATTSIDSKVSAVSTTAKTHIAVNNSSAKDSDEQVGFCKPAKTLKEGSVLDILRSPGFSSSPSQQTSASTPNRSTSTFSKTVGNAFSPVKVTLGVGGKQALGLWQCSACCHENMASDSNCTACCAAKPQPAETNKKLPASPQHSNTKTTVPLSSVQGLGDKFKLPAGTWDCDTCLVQNKAEVTKCVACETPKPGTGMKANLLLPPATKALNSAPTPSAFVSSSGSITNEEKPEGSWDCTGCRMQNKTENNTCVACKADKPGAIKSLSTAAPSGLLGLLDHFKKPAGSWDCDVCLIQNKPEATKCVACESAKPGTKPELKGTFGTVQTSAAPVSLGLGLLDQFKKSAGSWDCEVCLVENKPEANKCIACESAKPGTKAELKGFGTSTLSAGTTAPTFKFGVQPSDSTGELKSGASTDSTTSGFSFAKPIGDFKFGLASASATTEETGKKSFTFGTSTSNQASAGFKFGVASSAQTNQDTSGGFTFGSVSSTVSFSPAATYSGSTGLQVPAADDDSSRASAAGLKSAEEKKPEAPAVTAFSFGKTDQNKETVSTSFIFGKKDEKTDSAPTGNSFGFGLKKDGEEPKQFLFGKPEPTKEDSTSSTASAGFAFRVSNPTEKKDVEQPVKSVFAFGSQTSTTDAGASKQPFSFLTGVSSTSASSSASGVSSSVFGSVAQSSTPANPSNVFGSATSSNPSAVSSGVFGNLNPSNAPASSSTLFGNVAPSSTPSGSSSLFGTANPSSTPASSSSLFGTAAKLSAPVGSGGVFNSAAPVPPASTSSSVFGSAAPANTSANSANIFGSAGGTSGAPGTFVFGQPASTTSTVFGNSSESKSTFAFSGQETKPVTSAITSATPFVFGAESASTTPAAPGFNFGRTNTSNVTGTSSSPFIFGGGPTASASPSLTAHANPVPAFGQSANSSTAPAFGSSTSVFPAGNSQQVPAFGSSTAQPPVFGQQAAQPSFGSSAAPSAGSGFQFGNNTNFNFTTPNSSGGVFTFGANAGSTPQPPAPGFMFNAAASGFNVGTNGRSTPASSISNRKIKTARRRK
uniref:Nuclear pore complex protein Nup153 n=1 Tax=Xenopus tropicalis TaxID=8364 RepID=A0A803K319_XENTR